MTVVVLHALLLTVAAAVIIAIDKAVGPQRVGIVAGVAGLLLLLVAGDVLRVRDVPSLDAWLAGVAVATMGWLLATAKSKPVIVAAALGTWAGILVIVMRLGWVGRTGLFKKLGL